MDRKAQDNHRQTQDNHGKKDTGQSWRHRTIMQRKTQDNHGEKDIGQSWTDTGQPCKGGTIMERQDNHGEKKTQDNHEKKTDRGQSRHLHQD